MKPETDLTTAEGEIMTPREEQLAIQAIKMTASYYEKKVLRMYRITLAFCVGTSIVSLILFRLLFKLE
jgi:hypothetical protein